MPNSGYFEISTTRSDVLLESNQPNTVNTNAVYREGPYQIDDPRFWGYVNDPKVKIPNMSASDGLTHSGIWRAISFLMNKVANTPLYVRRRTEAGNSVIDRTHDGHKIARRMVSPIMRADEFKKSAVFQAAYSTGNAFAYINRVNGRFDSLTLLDPEQVIMYVLFDQENRGNNLNPQQIIYQVRRNGFTYYLDPSEIFHYKGAMTPDGLWGLRLIDYVKYAAGAGNAARDYALKFFTSGGKPSFLVYYPKRMSKAKEEPWLESVKKAVDSLGTDYSMIPLYNDAKIEKLSWEPDKTQSIETRKFSLQEVANYTGFPMFMFGLDDSQSYNSLEVASEIALDAVDPWFASFEAECNQKLLYLNEKQSESYFYEFAREEMRRVDHRTKVETAVLEVQNAGLTPNEYRRVMKREESTDENADSLIMQSNLVPIAKLGEFGNQGGGVVPAATSRASAATREMIVMAVRGVANRTTTKLSRFAKHDQSKLLILLSDPKVTEDFLKAIKIPMALIPGGESIHFEIWFSGIMGAIDEQTKPPHDGGKISEVTDDIIGHAMDLLDGVVCKYILEAKENKDD